MSKLTLVFAIAAVAGWVDPVAPASTSSISKNVDDLQYFYFPTPEKKIEIKYNIPSSLQSSNVRPNTPTVIIIDGFLSDSTSPMSTVTKESYIKKGGKNVIVIDWGKLSGSGLTLGNPLQTAAAYITVLGNVKAIGERLAEFIDFLRINKHIQLSDITLVGHSLGAHIAGAAGVAVRNAHGGQLIGEIIGLDPAGPFFSLQVSKDKRLHKGDAQFVAIYHTNRGTLGDSDHNTADVNLYVNGGKNQPGCEEADSSGFAGYCSHSYSHKFFNAAFNGNIRACPCSSTSACTCLTCSYECDNGILVGPDMPTSARGSYHVTLGPLA